MTDRTLLDSFLIEECIPSIREMLLAQIRDCRGTSVVRAHTFNRFNLRLDFESGSVLIEDDLEPGIEGEYQLSLSDFRRELEQWTESRRAP